MESKEFEKMVKICIVYVEKIIDALIDLFDYKEFEFHFKKMCDIYMILNLIDEETLKLLVKRKNSERTAFII